MAAQLHVQLMIIKTEGKDAEKKLFKVRSQDTGGMFVWESEVYDLIENLNIKHKRMVCEPADLAKVCNEFSARNLIYKKLFYVFILRSRL